MDRRMALYRLIPDADYNPACFDFTEQEARDKKLWRDPRPMPSNAELQAEYDAWVLEEEATSYKEKRKKDYETDGLHFDVFVEMLIENDEVGMANYRSERNAIKIKHPKP